MTPFHNLSTCISSCQRQNGESVLHHFAQKLQMNYNNRILDIYQNILAPTPPPSTTLNPATPSPTHLSTSFQPNPQGQNLSRQSNKDICMHQGINDFHYCLINLKWLYRELSVHYSTYPCSYAYDFCGFYFRHHNCLLHFM